MTQTTSSEPLDRAKAEQWVRQSPGDWRAHAALGEAYLEAAKLRQARASLRHAALLNPQDADLAYKINLISAQLDASGRARALVEVERTLAGRGQLGLLGGIVDATIARRTHWLGSIAHYGSLGYAVLVFVHADEGSLVPANADRSLFGILVLLAAVAAWFLPLWTQLTPAARATLTGLPRRDPLLAFELAGTAGALAIMLAVPPLWVLEQRTACLVVAVIGVCLPYATEILTLGILMGTGQTSRLSGFTRVAPHIFFPALLVAVAAFAVTILRIMKRRRSR